MFQYFRLERWRWRGGSIIPLAAIVFSYNQRNVTRQILKKKNERKKEDMGGAREGGEEDEDEEEGGWKGAEERKLGVKNLQN